MNRRSKNRAAGAMAGAAIIILALASGAWGTTPASPPKFQPAVPLGPVVAARAGAPEVLSLPDCVQQALRANDELAAQRLRRGEIDGQLKQALATGLPTLDLVGDWSRGRDPSFALDSTFGGGGGGGGIGTVPGADPWFNDWLAGFGSFIPAPEDIQPQSFWRANANLNWTLNPLQVIGAVGAARLGLQQQDLNETAVAQQVADRTVAAYFGIIKAAERIRAVEAELANQSELLAIMKLRFDLGVGTRLDTLQAAVTRANVVPRLRIARANLRNQGSRLNAVMGRAPELPLSVANDLVLETDPIQDEVALHLAQRRPDLAASGLSVDILRRTRQAQIADNRPYLTLFGSYGYVGNQLDGIFENGHDSWRASVALTVPLFDGLNTRGRVAQTNAQIRRSEAELSGQQRQVQVEVLETLANLRMAREVLTAVALNLQRSEEVLDESLLNLQMGKVAYLDVLVAESNRAEAHSSLIDARYEVLVLTSSLKRALGFSPLLPLRAIPNLTAEGMEP